MKEHCCGVLSGAGPQVAALRAAVEAVSPLEGPVLLLGEIGVGKERIARCLHALSPGRELPLQLVDCSRSFEDELEGVLLGLESSGACYLAHCEELSPRLQGWLAGYLSGSPSARVMMSSPRDLACFTRAGLYSKRLFDIFRDSRITVPPLRQRTRDLGRIIDYQAGKLEPSPGARTFSPEAFGALATYPWPGNYRQLEAEVQRVLRHGSGKIELQEVSPEIASFWIGGAEAAEIRRLHDGLGVESCRDEHRVGPGTGGGPSEAWQRDNGS